MGVQLREDGRPVTWGDGIEGADIPHPPEDHDEYGPRDFYWADGEWHPDPIEEDPLAHVPPTRRRVYEAVTEGDLSAEDAVRYLLLRDVPPDVDLPEPDEDGG
jgi:hypothetical protein